MPTRDFKGIHEETLVDGELIVDTLPSGESLISFMIFDLLLINGINVLHENLDRRLQVQLQRKPCLSCSASMCKMTLSFHLASFSQMFVRQRSPLGLL